MITVAASVLLSVVATTSTGLLLAVAGVSWTPSAVVAPRPVPQNQARAASSATLYGHQRPVWLAATPAPDNCSWRLSAPRIAGGADIPNTWFRSVCGLADTTAGDRMIAASWLEEMRTAV